MRIALRFECEIIVSGQKHGPIEYRDVYIYELILYSNMTSLIDFLNNTMIKLTIYFNSHMRIDEQISNIIS